MKTFMNEDHLTEEETREVERLSRALDDVLHVGPEHGGEPDDAPSGHVAAAAMAILVANHVAQQPDHRAAYASFGQMVQDMVKLLLADRMGTGMAREYKLPRKARRH